MSASSCSLDGPEKLLLRWSEGFASPSREALVEILDMRISEAVICCALKLVEKTEVFLIGKNTSDSGVVRSCRPLVGGKFIVTILIHSQSPRLPEPDPGMLLVDDFMTEEQEQSILDEVDEEIRRQQFRSLAAARAYLASTRYEGTVALNRLLKFTLRSSTALVSNSLTQFRTRFRQVTGAGPFARLQSNTNSIPPAGPTLPASQSPVGISVSIQ